MIYRLPVAPSPELHLQLACLQDCVQTHPVFKEDLKRLAGIEGECCWIEGVLPACPCGQTGPEEAAGMTAAQLLLAGLLRSLIAAGCLASVPTFEPARRGWPQRVDSSQWCSCSRTACSFPILPSK